MNSKNLRELPDFAPPALDQGNKPSFSLNDFCGEGLS
jgi:hypothetical protein